MGKGLDDRRTRTQGKNEVSYQRLALFRVNGWPPAQPR